MQANNKLILGGVLAAAVVVVGVLVFVPRPTAQGPGEGLRPSGDAAQTERGAPRPTPIAILDETEADEAGTALTPTPAPPTVPNGEESPPGADGPQEDAEATAGEGVPAEGEATSPEPPPGAPDEVARADDSDNDDDDPSEGLSPRAMAARVAPAAPLASNYESPRGRLGGGEDGQDAQVRPTPTPAPGRNGDNDSPGATPTPSPTPRATPTPSPTPDIGRASIFLDPAAVTVVEGDYFTLDLYVHSPEKPVAGYTTLVLYVPIEVEVVQIREGRDPMLGYPMVARNDPRSGTLVLAAMQGSSLTQPVGELHLLSIDFEAVTPGTVDVNLVDSDVANTDAQEMILIRESGTRVTVEPLEAPE